MFYKKSLIFMKNKNLILLTFYLKKYNHLMKYKIFGKKFIIIICIYFNKILYWDFMNFLMYNIYKFLMMTNINKKKIRYNIL